MMINEDAATKTAIPVRIKQDIRVAWSCNHCPQLFTIKVVSVDHSRPLRTGQPTSEAMLTVSIREESFLDMVALHMKECDGR